MPYNCQMSTVSFYLLHAYMHSCNEDMLHHAHADAKSEQACCITGIMSSAMV